MCSLSDCQPPIPKVNWHDAYISISNSLNVLVVDHCEGVYVNKGQYARCCFTVYAIKGVSNIDANYYGQDIALVNFYWSFLV